MAATTRPLPFRTPNAHPSTLHPPTLSSFTLSTRLPRPIASSILTYFDSGVTIAGDITAKVRSEHPYYPALSEREVRLVLMNTGRIGALGFAKRRRQEVLCFTGEGDCQTDCGVRASMGGYWTRYAGRDDGKRRRKPSVFGPVLVGSDDVSIPAWVFMGWVLLTCLYMTMRIGCGHVGVPVIGSALVFVWRSLVVSGLL